jgi:hypothetical protein
MATSIPSTSITKFQLTSAPTGWTKITSYNDYAIRVTTGVTSTGGTRNFSAVFANQSPTAAGTMGGLSLAIQPTVAGNPSHSHPTLNNISSVTPGGPGASPLITLLTIGSPVNTPGQTTFPANVQPAGQGAGHSHPITVPAPILTGPTPLTASADFTIRYLDMIIAQRN